MFVDERSKLTAVDEVFGGHSLTVFHCHKCRMVNVLSVIFTTVKDKRFFTHSLSLILRMTFHFHTFIVLVYCYWLFGLVSLDCHSTKLIKLNLVGYYNQYKGSYTSSLSPKSTAKFVRVSLYSVSLMNGTVKSNHIFV